MNDDARKGAMTKAAFFTLIPMLLVGCLVWSGMKGENENTKLVSEKYAKIESDLTKKNTLLSLLSDYQDSIRNMMDQRLVLEDKFIKAYKEDSLNTVSESAQLNDFENKIKIYLTKASDEIRSVDVNNIASAMFVRSRKELELCQKNWLAVASNPSFVSDDDTGKKQILKEKVANSEEKIRKLEHEKRMMELKQEGTRNQKSDSDNLKGEIAKLKGDIEKRKESELLFIEEVFKSFEGSCKGIERNKCNKDKINSAKGKMDTRKITIRS